MKKQFAYFYFMKKNPDKIQQVVPAHVEYWKNSHVEGYSGGPFGDRSGGMITFKAENLERAEQLADQDPFVIEDLLDNRWLKEWIVL